MSEKHEYAISTYLAFCIF